MAEQIVYNAGYGDQKVDPNPDLVVGEPAINAPLMGNQSPAMYNPNMMGGNQNNMMMGGNQNMQMMGGNQNMMMNNNQNNVIMSENTRIMMNNNENMTMYMNNQNMRMGDPNLPRCYLCQELAVTRCFGKGCGFKPCEKPICRQHMKIARTGEDVQDQVCQQLCIQCYPKWMRAKCVMASLVCSVLITSIVIFACCYEPSYYYN